MSLVDPQSQSTTAQKVSLQIKQSPVYVQVMEYQDGILTLLVMDVLVPVLTLQVIG